MNTIFADYNATTEAGHVRLTCPGSEDDIRSRALHPGDWAWLSDTEVVVGAQLAIDHYYGLVGIPDWDTLIPLDEDDVRDCEVVRAELLRLHQERRRSRDEERRILQLLTAFEFLAPRKRWAPCLPGISRPCAPRRSTSSASPNWP